MKTKNRINLAELVIVLVKEKTALIEQNSKKDLIIEQLKERLSNYEGE